MYKTKMILIAAFTMLLSLSVEAKTIRATELNNSTWSKFTSGALSDMVVEFRQGDELPVNLLAEGDLIETTQSATSYIGVKRNFWLKLQNDNIQISLDGVTFRPLREVLSGSLDAGAGTGKSGGLASALEISLKAFLK